LFRNGAAVVVSGAALFAKPLIQRFFNGGLLIPIGSRVS
jgi:hypothetical protein